jgi:hypothetical protein
LGEVAAGVDQVGVEVLATAGAIVLGVEHDEGAGPAGEGAAQVIEGASRHAITVGAMAAARSGLAAVIPAQATDLGLGQVVDAVDALGGINSVFIGSRPGKSSGRRVLPGNTPDDGNLFTKSAR